MKKKTYVFSERALQALEELKKITNKKETQIIEEAILLYLDYVTGKECVFTEVKKVTDNIVTIINKVEELSYKLGRCEAEKEFLKNEKS